VVATAVLAALAALALWLLLREGLHDAWHDALRVSGRAAPVASFVGLYLEESGVPLPLSGDFMVVYLGHHFARMPLQLIAIWAGLVLTVLAGSTNLYLVARFWGRSLLRGRLAPLFHLTPRRLARAEAWFRRWGAPTVIVGRHVFGMRVPVTVAAGLFGLPYRLFAPSVVVSTMVWAGVWLWLAVRYGDRVLHFMAGHRLTYAVPIALVLLLAGGTALSIWRAFRETGRRRGKVE
jgi:membrane-associated protein